MTDEQIQNLMDMNFRVILLLGMVTPILVDYKACLPAKDHYKIDWFLEALNNVIYLNKQIPPFPEKEFL